MQSSWAMFYQYIPVYFIHTWGNNINLSSLYLTVLGLIMAFGLIGVYYWLLNYFSLKKISGACFVIALVTSLMLLIVHKVDYFYIAGSVYALVIGLYYPALVTLMSHELVQAKQGLLMGYNTMLMAFAWFTTSFLFGILSKFNVLYPFLYQITFILMALGVFLFSQRHQSTADNRIDNKII